MIVKWLRRRRERRKVAEQIAWMNDYMRRKYGR